MKAANKALLYARAERALTDLYHNATITYPRDLYGRSDDYFQSWIDDAAQFEIEYIAGGGSTPGDYRATLAHPANAGKYKSAAARAYYIRKGLRDRNAERFDCGILTGWRVLELAAGNARLVKIMRGYPGATRNNALWERICEFGKLYQWGRGGRTLAPKYLVKQHGGSSFSIKDDYAEEMNPAACVDLIGVLESFNRYVGAWCTGVPWMWREHCETEDAEEKAAKVRASVRKAKETRERNYWAARDMVTA